MKFAYLLGAAVVVITGCSQPSATTTAQKKEAEKPLEALTGRQAYQQMYVTARGWASDCQPVQLRNIPLSEVKAEPGKSGAWQCLFVSPGRNRSRTYTWSAIEAEGNLHRGVFAGPDESYSPSPQQRLFLTAAIRTDSDEAYQTAAAKSADYLKKNPGKQVNFLLEQTPRFPDLTWRIFWGETVGTSDYSVFIDATSGQFLTTAH